MASHMSSSTQQTEHVAGLTLGAQHTGPSDGQADVRGRSVGSGVHDRSDLDALMEAEADRLREQAERDLDEWEDLDAWMGYGDGYD